MFKRANELDTCLKTDDCKGDRICVLEIEKIIADKTMKKKKFCKAAGRKNGK